jgi:predicted ferric reductase
MASGLIISNKMARIWPGGFTAFDLHQFSSLLGMAFVVVHVVVLLGNAYVPYNLVQLLVPFAGDNYRPVWVGLGQLSLYLLIPVTFTFYIRKRLGNHLWHAIHFISYPVFALMVLHGLLSGTDSGNQWVTDIYWATSLSLVALTAYRVLERRAGTLRSV